MTKDYVLQPQSTAVNASQRSHSCRPGWSILVSVMTPDNAAQPEAFWEPVC